MAIQESTLLVTICVWISAFLLQTTTQTGLDDYILHYEPLYYDTNQLHQSHLRSKRSTDPSVTLQFTAYGRNFNLKLKKDNGIFASDHKITGTDGTLHDVDTSFIYQGEDEGVPGSYVHGSILRGIFRGWVEIPRDSTYHIEPSAMFFNHTQPFHTVIYSEKYTNLDPFRERRAAEKSVGVCGYDRAEAWMRAVSESVASVPPNRAKRATDEFSYHNKYSEFAQTLNRIKRTSLGTHNTCNLYIQTDPLFFTKWAMSRTNKDKEMAKDEILAFIASHVLAIKNIYSRTPFNTYDKTISYTGINFQVQRTTIMTDESEFCKDPLNAKAFCNPNIDVSNFLNLNSLTDHSEFCLAYVFTYRDFTQGTLGLAWVGSPSRAAGGICEKYRDYPEGNSKVWKSLNTGIVTIVNYGKAVPAKVSQLTFAHEVGHNFGSPHDSGPGCAPYGTRQIDSNEGNYIMFASATPGDKIHNSQFSGCSMDNITRVLDSVINNRFGKINCFKVSGEAFCGNALVEGREECDCGYSDECIDKCCNAKEAGAGVECKRAFDTFGRKYPCSPTEGPCCLANNCSFRTESFLCREADECTERAYCHPNQAKCPPSTPKADESFCNEFSQICIDGNCIGSLCHKIKWQECFLRSDESNNEDVKEKLCYLGCKPNTTDGECVSSANLDDVRRYPELEKLLTEANTLRGESGTQFQLPAGSPCDNFRGYCDVFHICRGVDAEGPLARLKNLIFSPKTLETIKDWIVKYWWAVMLMSLGLVIFMGLFIKFCAVHTPSSNPNQKPAQKLSHTLTLRRRRQHHPPQHPQQNPQQQGPHDPPPPYSGPSHGVAGPPHGHRHHGQKRRGQDMELHKI